MPNKGSFVVILVHGLWMTKAALSFQRRYLQRHGYEVALYSYPSRRATLSDAARGLAQLVSAQRADQIHLVGHSMGGMVILQMLEEFPLDRIGRIVLMGTPYRDSAPARALIKSEIGRWFLGVGIPQWLKKDKSKTIMSYELGVIAGCCGFGLGQMLARLPVPHDGTVAVKETQIPDMRDSIVLPVTHTGMLVSSKVASQVYAFLETGRFNQLATTR